jgi:HAD superfamily hydrolase (TIGR01509 family)
MTDAITKHIPLLQKIPHWITREDYQEAKPSPQGYLKAIEKFAHPQDQIIGFEDSPRGLQALLGTKAKPVWVTEVNYPEIPPMIERGVLHIPTFNQFIF